MLKIPIGKSRPPIVVGPGPVASLLMLKDGTGVARTELLRSNSTNEGNHFNTGLM